MSEAGGASGGPDSDAEVHAAVSDASKRVDSDGDGILDDGDASGAAGDTPCRGGVATQCDDNCRRVRNPDQQDADADGIGDACIPPSCQSASTLVAVGYRDQIYVSNDMGTSWVRRSTGLDSALWENVHHANGTWIVADSSSRSIARSTDTVNWSVFDATPWPGGHTIEAVFEADGVWFLGSENGRWSMSRDDGLSFDSAGVIANWSGAVEHFVQLKGRLIAVGDRGQIGYTDDPTDVAAWEVQIVGRADYKAVAVSSDTLMAVGTGGGCILSVDLAETWSDCGIDTKGDFYDVDHVDGLWIVSSFSGEQLLTSTSGRGGWVSHSAGEHRPSAVFVDCASGRWVLSSDEPSRLATSDDDGNSWVVRQAGETGAQLEYVTGN